MYKIGQELTIIDGGNGNDAIIGRHGYVTDAKATKGLNIKKGFNIDLGNFGVWRVSNKGKYDLTKRFGTQFPSSNTHIYERQGYDYTVIVKEPSGRIIDTQIKRIDDETYKVIYNIQKGETIVILGDGSKGIAQCDPEDNFVTQIGYSIAMKRAKINQLEKEIKMLSK